MTRHLEELVSENDVKAALKKMLKEEGAFRFSCAAGGVGSTYGISDDVVCYKGYFIAIESKRPGRRGEENGGLSTHQVKFGRGVIAAGGLFFKADNHESIERIRERLRAL